MSTLVKKGRDYHWRTLDTGSTLVWCRHCGAIRDFPNDKKWKNHHRHGLPCVVCPQITRAVKEQLA